MAWMQTAVTSDKSKKYVAQLLFPFHKIEFEQDCVISVLLPVSMTKARLRCRAYVSDDEEGVDGRTGANLMIRPSIRPG